MSDTQADELRYLPLTRQFDNASVRYGTPASLAAMPRRLHSTCWVAEIPRDSPQLGLDSNPEKTKAFP